MNKAQLVESIVNKSGLSKAEAGKAVNAFISTVSEELSKGGKVGLVGFGTFSVTKRSERKSRNFTTKQMITVPASKAPKFKAGKSLKEAVSR